MDRDKLKRIKIEAIILADGIMIQDLTFLNPDPGQEFTPKIRYPTKEELQRIIENLEKSVKQMEETL